MNTTIKIICVHAYWLNWYLYIFFFSVRINHIKPDVNRWKKSLALFQCSKIQILNEIPYMMEKYQQVRRKLNNDYMLFYFQHINWKDLQTHCIEQHQFSIIYNPSKHNLARSCSALIFPQNNSWENTQESNNTNQRYTRNSR